MAKILIAALGAELGGAIRHLTNFLPALAKADQDREYIVLVRENFPKITVSKNIRLERIDAALTNNWRRRLFFDLKTLPQRVRNENFSAIVSILNTGPLSSPVPHILFQRNSLYFCNHYLSRVHGAAKVETYLRRQLALQTIKRADIVVTPSEAMAEMIRQSSSSFQKRMFVVLPHGYETSALGDPLGPEYASILNNCRGKRLLYPTHPAPHKGFEILFNAIAHLKKSGVKLSLLATVDPADWPSEVARYQDQIDRLDIADSIHFLGRVPQRQMGSLYQASDLMVYPSLCESFGFSMLEALGHELPVVAARTQTNMEICQDAALYFDPFDHVAFSKAICKATESDTRKQLIEKGNQVMSSFDWSWKRYALEFRQLIDSVH